MNVTLMEKDPTGVGANVKTGSAVFGWPGVANVFHVTVPSFQESSSWMMSSVGPGLVIRICRVALRIRAPRGTCPSLVPRNEGNLIKLLQIRPVVPTQLASTWIVGSLPKFVFGVPLSRVASSVSLNGPVSPLWYVRVIRVATVTSNGVATLTDVFEAVTV